MTTGRLQRAAARPGSASSSAPSKPTTQRSVGAHDIAYNPFVKILWGDESYPLAMEGVFEILVCKMMVKTFVTAVRTELEKIPTACRVKPFFTVTKVFDHL